MRRWIDESGFHTLNGDRFWSRPLYGPNRRSFVATGELPQAAFVWFDPRGRSYVRCGHLIPGVVTDRGAKWLCEAEETTATYDPGMMRFTVKDAVFDGELRLDVIPLVDSDGYVLRVACSSPVELAFSFGGFWCLLEQEKDSHQGIGVMQGGIIAEHYRDSDYADSGDGDVSANLHRMTDREGQVLTGELTAHLLSDHETTTSLHEAKTGLSLRGLLAQPQSSSSTQLHRVTLIPEEPLHIAVVIPTTDQPEVELGAIRSHLAEVFNRRVAHAKEVSHRVNLQTPDTLVDLAARSLSVSLDGLWVPPTFMHGPIRWGWSGLAGWRMAYGADVCGNYDRVASHCRYYGEHRHKNGLDRKPHADSGSLLTRQAGDSLTFSEGRLDTGVYNMTEMWLSFINHHYHWTGDREFLREMWPAIRDAVGYQKRALDMDNDSLYENYANTYITDAHWHNGGNCAQASAYTYRGNLLAAEAARIVGESPEPFLADAARIKKAMNRVLWVKDKGVFAEWKDILGEKLRHEEPELGSVYLPTDCGIADDFQTYQMLRFTEWGLPTRSFEETGPQPFDDGLYPNRQATYEFPQPMQVREIKSSNWKPMLVTVHECSPGEMMDTARCYYKLGLNDRAFPIVKAVLRNMVNLTTPGGLVIRDRNAETWQRSWGNGDIDHCDTLGPSQQCLVEGLFGIQPRFDQDRIEIQPGFPSDWDHAEIQLRDVACSFRRDGRTDTFKVTTTRPTEKRLRLVLRGDGATVKVNGRTVRPRIVAGIGNPLVVVEAPRGETSEFIVSHNAQSLPSIRHRPIAACGTQFVVTCDSGSIEGLKDPQEIFDEAQTDENRFSATVVGNLGHHTAFVKVKGKNTKFWQPVDLEIREPLDIVDANLTDDAGALSFAVRKNCGVDSTVEAGVRFAGQEVKFRRKVAFGRKSQNVTLSLTGAAELAPGVNPLTLLVKGRPAQCTPLECWDLLRRDPRRKAAFHFEPVDLGTYFNDNLSLVHTHEYVSPRSPYCSLQPGIDLFREWCSCSGNPCGVLDLGLLRDEAAKNGGILPTEPGIPFRASADGKNIVFVSQWDNFPKRVKIPVARPARHVYLLMASVTNPMQSGVVNGRVVLDLGLNRRETLELVNPKNLSWCVTNYPNRYGPLDLTQPSVRLGEHVYAMIYSIPLREDSQVKSISVEAVSIESVIGLMAVTLLHP